MRTARYLIGLLTFAFAVMWAQEAKIVIPAGTPEDKDLSAISAEPELQKRAAMYEEFLKKYSDNNAASAYAQWQLSQQYLSAGDAAKAWEYGEKALALYPNNLDIIVSDENVAQALKDSDKIVALAAQGGAVFQSIAKQTKPADMSDSQWETTIAEQQNAARPSYEFLEAAAFNAIAAEQNANKRMEYIEKFTPAFPNSKFGDSVSQLAMMSLQQLNQPQRVEAYGEKVLAANPDSVPTLLMLANVYAADPQRAAKAETYANKVIQLSKAGTPDTEKNRKLTAGAAHSTLGYAYLQQDKLAAAIPELKNAVALLQDDAHSQQEALFRLGWAYAKQNHKADAISTLQKAAAIEGPYQAPAKEMLSKIEAAGPVRRK